jgi:flagellum-specific ATP synthase
LNHYPAIDVLSSVSRLTRDLLSPEQLEASGRARENLAVYRKNQDLITIGAYTSGSSAAIDQAIRLQNPLMGFLRQEVTQSKTISESWQLLGQVMSPPIPPPSDNKQRGK